MKHLIPPNEKGVTRSIAKTLGSFMADAIDSDPNEEALHAYMVET